MELKMRASDLMATYILNMQLMRDTRQREVDAILTDLKNAQDLLDTRYPY
jgi:hypothetical protein